MKFPNTIIDDQGRHRVPEPELITLALRLMDLYVQLRPNYVAGPTRVPAKSAVQFYKAAARCRDLGQTPEEYMTQQLQGMVQTNCLWSTAVASAKVANKAAHDDQWGVQKTRHYQCQLALFEHRASIHGPHSTIRDPANDFTPLIRCVLAHTFGLDDVIQEYKEQARLEYAAVPVAARAFSGIVGGWLINESDLQPIPRTATVSSHAPESGADKVSERTT